MRRLSSLSSLFLLSRPRPSLSVTRFYSTNDPGVPHEATPASSTKKRLPLISKEMLDEAGRDIDMEEVYAEALSMQGGLDTTAPTLEDVYSLDSTLEEFRGDDSTSVGHHILRNRREILEYFRLIELELPSLQAFRKPFTPPSPTSSPIIARTMTYGGIKHPVQRKAALVIPIARLPLANDAAIHKFKLLAGVRWSLEPPKDSGVGKEEMRSEEGNNHGYFKISHEAFPQLSMNLKWCSDTLDKLLVQANSADETFEDVPLDTRHLASQARKRRKGQQRIELDRGERRRPTIADFPKEWLPKPAQVARIRELVARRQRTRAAMETSILSQRTPMSQGQGQPQISLDNTT